MKINHKFKFVKGDFDMDKGEIECVSNSKYNLVELCFKGNMFIPFAEIVLYTRDYHASEVFEDAEKLGDEICRRWNNELKNKQKS